MRRPVRFARPFLACLLLASCAPPPDTGPLTPLPALERTNPLVTPAGQDPNGGAS